MLEQVSPSRTALIRRLLPCLLGVIAVLYGFAWFAPAIGLTYSEGAALATAVYHTGDLIPPLFPALLAPFAMISRQSQWLKLLPLGCTVLWLLLTKRLLSRMGASSKCAMVLIVMTAASPTVLYLATGLYPEPLFAVLVTVSLLALIDEKALLAGLFAGLATITVTAGMTLILAGLVTLVANRRLRGAAVFTGVSMAFAAPWLGWCMANGGVPAAHLHLSDLGAVFAQNVMMLAASPFMLLSGYPSLYPGLLTAVALLIVIVRRRQFVPDLFIGLYCFALVWRTEQPMHAFAPILPTFLWLLWRVARSGRFATVTKVTAALLLLPALWFGVARLTTVRTLGAVTRDSMILPAPLPNDWHEMEKLFAFIQGNTPPDAVLLADLDPVFRLNTGRTTVRGFVPDNYRSVYAPPSALVTTNQLRDTIAREHVGWVALTPDRDLPEAASFHKAVAAMERGGLLEPVSVPGVAREYRLLHVAGAK